MFWVIRWVDDQTDQDVATVIAAATRNEAEAAARAQGIPYILIARACQSDLADARAAAPPRRRAATALFPGTAGPAQDRPGHAPPPGATRHTCLGRRVGHPQLAALLLAGVATAFLHLRPILPAIVS